MNDETLPLASFAFPQAVVPHRHPRWRVVAIALLALALLTSLEANAGGKKTRNTLIGAGLGAAGGALLSHGDPWATIGGAAAGGLIGNVVTHGDHHSDRGRHDDRRPQGGRDRRRGRDRRGH